MGCYIDGIKKYATFTGRASRKEYWLFYLFNSIFIITSIILDNVFRTTFYSMGINFGYGWIYILYTLFATIPSLAIAVRRLHDQNKSGCSYFVILIPFIGSIWLIVLMCTEGTRGPNNYGEDPNGSVADIRLAPNNVVGTDFNRNYIDMNAVKKAEINNVEINKDIANNNPRTDYISGLTGVFAGQKFVLSNKVTFGRDPKNCNIIFPLEQPGISSVHCAITSDSSGVFLTDLGSTYGTYLANGTKLSANQKMKLNNRDVFYLSSENCKFEFRAV